MSKSLSGIELLKEGCLPGAATYNQVAKAIQRCSSASPNLDIRMKADGGMEFEINDIVRDDDYRALRYPFKATIARNKDNGNVISWKWRGGVIHQQSKDIIVEPGTASFNQQEPYLWLTITNEGTARVTSGKQPEREPKTPAGQVAHHQAGRGHPQRGGTLRRLPGNAGRPDHGDAAGVVL